MSSKNRSGTVGRLGIPSSSNRRHACSPFTAAAELAEVGVSDQGSSLHSLLLEPVKDLHKGQQVRPRPTRGGKEHRSPLACRAGAKLGPLQSKMLFCG